MTPKRTLLGLGNKGYLVRVCSKNITRQVTTLKATQRGLGAFMCFNQKCFFSKCFLKTWHQIHTEQKYELQKDQFLYLTIGSWMCKRKQLPPQAINDKPGWDATTPLETGTVHSWTQPRNSGVCACLNSINSVTWWLQCASTADQTFHLGSSICT